MIVRALELLRERGVDEMSQFFPRWQPRYLVYQGAFGLPRASLAEFVNRGACDGTGTLTSL